MKIAPQELLGLLVATSFAAGLNVYAAVATLGLLAHAGVLPLPPALEIVSNWWVIGASGVLFLVEFFADKVPAFDLIWNALHTFVRIPVAALLAYGATTSCPLRNKCSLPLSAVQSRSQLTGARPQSELR